MGLRFGIDAESLRLPLSGVGNYAFHLCSALERELADAQFFAYGRHPADRLALPSTRWLLRQETYAPLRKLPSYLWLKSRGRALCVQDELDVFWAPRTIHPNLPRSIRTLSTIHDLNHLLVPETMEKISRVMHALFFARDLRLADCVLANSAGTASRLRDRLGIEADAVIRPGLHARYRPLETEERAPALEALRALGVRPPYLLSVATLEPRKNVAATLGAFLALKRSGVLAQHQLVLVGSTGWHNNELLEQLRQAESEGVVLTGYLPVELLPALYGLAEMLLFPSLYEGYGMPALEARACGTPAVIADIPELVEAAGPAAIRVKPTPEGVRAGILAAQATAPHRAGLAASIPAGFASWTGGARTLARAARGQPLHDAT
jgi:glycosyltransferase involved in cell wall biosynthesis